MQAKEQLIRAIEQAPDSLIEEVLDFLLFKQARENQKTLEASSPTQDAVEPIQTHKSIWEIAEELMADVPPEVLEKLPRDGAAQHDHYLYGSPKRES